MARPTQVTVTVRDLDGDTAQWGFFVGSGQATLAAILAQVEPVVEAAALLMTGVIEQVQLTIPVNISGYTLTPSAGQDQDRRVGGRFVFKTADNDKAQINLPSFDIETYVPTPGSLIDTTDANVSNFIVAVGTSAIATNQDKDLTALATAYETYGGKKD